MGNLVNHPGFWLADAAAASLARLEAAHGKVEVSSAGRTVQEQQGLIDRWNKGGAANRPPNLYRPAMPASASRHTTGMAFDTNDQSHMNQYGPEYGWTHPFAYDAVHYEYVASQDQHRGGAAGAPQTANDVVKREQNFMNIARGEHLVEDGIAGPATVAAFKRYQEFLRDHYGYKGAIDGVWGPATQNAHSSYFAQWDAARNPTPKSSSTTLKQGSSGAAVKNLQATLNANYPAYSKLVVDGQFGPATDKVVREFQRRAGLTVDGIAGPNTLGRLGL